MSEPQRAGGALRRWPVQRYLLAGVIAFQLTLALAWQLADRTPPYWDEASFLYQGARQLEALRKGGLVTWYKTWIGLERIRPSLIATLTMPFYAAFGVSNDVGNLANVAAFAGVLLATYALGTAIHDERTGLLASALLGTYPAIIGLAHILFAEMLMIALVAATLLALWRSNGLRSISWSAVAGVCTGLGLLSKVFFFIFVAGPWAVTLSLMFRDGPDGWRKPEARQLGNLALAILLAAALAGAWYLPNLGPLLDRSINAAVGQEAALYGPEHPLRWDNLVSYLFGFVNRGISVAGFVMLLVGLIGLGVGYIRGRKARAQTILSLSALCFLSSSLLLGYAVFTSLTNQLSKHVTGILPAVAVLSAWGIVRLSGRRWPAAATSILLLMIGQVWLGTFPGPLKNRPVTVRVAGRPLHLVFPAHSWVNIVDYAAPEATPLPSTELLDYALFVANLEALPDHRADIGAFCDYPPIEFYCLVFEAYRRHQPARIHWASPDKLGDFDVVVGKTQDCSSVQYLLQQDIEELKVQFAGGDSGFAQMPRTFPLPDGSEAVVYARRASPMLQSAPMPSRPTDVVFGDSARFLGVDVEVTSDLAGELSLVLTYYWETLAPTAGDYAAFVHFLKADSGEIAFQDDHLLFAKAYPSSMWQPGRYLVDRRTVAVSAEYRDSPLMLRLGLYNQHGRLPVTFPSVSPEGRSYVDVGLIELPSG